MEPIRPGDFSDITTVTDPRLDPTGGHVAYLRTVPDDDESYATSIFLHSFATGAERRLTIPAGADAEPRWRPDGSAIAFVSDRLTEDERPQLWCLPIDGGEARQVTTVCGGVSSLAWSPDGDRIAFTQQVDPTDIEADRDLEVPEGYEREDPDPRVIDRTIYRANGRYFDRRREQVYVVDVETGSIDRVSTWDDTDHQLPVWGTDTTLFYLTKAGPDPDDSLTFQFVRIDLDTGDAEVIADVEGFVSRMAATDDGRVLFDHAPTPRPTLRPIYLRLLDPDTSEIRTLTEDLDRTLDHFGRIMEDGAYAYFITPDEGGQVLRRTTLEGATEEVLVDPTADVDGFDVRGDELVIAQGNWEYPSDLWYRSDPAAAERRLTTVNEDLLAERAVERPEELWFEGPDGDAIQGWLLTPPAEAPTDEPYPLILEIHGGPHFMYTTSGSMWHEFQSLAGAGYAVLWTNPRGSTGYGAEFLRAIADDWGDVTAADLLTAIDEVTERDEIDGDQLFVTGGSFGGYQTAWLIGQTDRFAAAVAQRGLYDLPTFYGTSDSYRLVESEFDVVPWEDHALVYDRSPLSLVEEVATPTLLLHSENDYRTPIATAEMYFRALRKLEVPVRLVRYPREGHELSRSGEPAHRIDRLERITRWFDGYGEHTDVPPALERSPNADLSTAPTIR